MHASRQQQHSCADLVYLFDRCFLAKWNTRLVGGAPEPVYVPADSQQRQHRVLFTHDYFASALHEIAHWCIAGEERRTQLDYGYWYAPDGRTAGQQVEFERVEVRPQALEWIFSEACGAPFRVSADNLSGSVQVSEAFKENITKQAHGFCTNGLNERARRFVLAAARHYGVTDPLNLARYHLRKLT